jgi:hypothetical protein
MLSMPRTPGGFSLKYHVAWCPQVPAHKYRLPVLVGPVDVRPKALLRIVAEERGMTLHTVEVMPDHVYRAFGFKARNDLSRKWTEQCLGAKQGQWLQKPSALADGSDVYRFDPPGRTRASRGPNP